MPATLQIVVDENIPFAMEAFGGLGRVRCVPGRHITREMLRHADVLIVRSATPINAQTLDGTPVKFVGSATIGTDHVDRAYLEKQGIAFANASGCNSQAVAEYVFTAIAFLMPVLNKAFATMTLGVIGVGNIGSRVARLGEALGMRVLRNDPPLQRQNPEAPFVSLEKALQCDIVSLHVPLTKSGTDPTYHLLDWERLQRLRPGTLLINTSRGAVVDNAALRETIPQHDLKTVLDVWEGEPDPDIRLVERALLGTPHIAGYSLEGRSNGTHMIYQALCEFLGKPATWKPALPAVHDRIRVDGNMPPEQALALVLRQVYDIQRDSEAFKNIVLLPRSKRGAYFDHLRKTYPLRREFRNYTLDIHPWNDSLAHLFKAFHFKIGEQA